MAQATVDNNTRRRDFLALTAAVATAVMARPALASPPDDSALLTLEDQIFEQHELASAHDDEMERLAAIWQAESYRLRWGALDPETGRPLTPEQRWDRILEMPEAKEHNRLGRLQEAHFVKMGALVKEMWALPALTPEGRRAKVLVALRLLPDNWREADENANYEIRNARQLLIEFVGGEPGAQLRDQFA